MMHFDNLGCVGHEAAKISSKYSNKLPPPSPPLPSGLCSFIKAFESPCRQQWHGSKHEIPGHHPNTHLPGVICFAHLRGAHLQHTPTPPDDRILVRG